MSFTPFIAVANYSLACLALLQAMLAGYWIQRQGGFWFDLHCVDVGDCGDAFWYPWRHGESRTWFEQRWRLCREVGAKMILLLKGPTLCLELKRMFLTAFFLIAIGDDDLSKTFPAVLCSMVYPSWSRKYQAVQRESSSDSSMLSKCLGISSLYWKLEEKVVCLYSHQPLRDQKLAWVDQQATQAAVFNPSILPATSVAFPWRLYLQHPSDDCNKLSNRRTASCDVFLHLCRTIPSRLLVHLALFQTCACCVSWHLVWQTRWTRHLPYKSNFDSLRHLSVSRFFNVDAYYLETFISVIVLLPSLSM